MPDMRTCAAILLCALPLAAQPAPAYEHTLVGNPADAHAKGTGGYILAGGGTDQPAAFKWMIERAGGGDIVIIRASGADAYNQWILDLGGADSVETIVFKDRSAASDPFVLERLRNAEAVFIAGGDQSRYVNFWKGTPVEDELHALVKRGGPIGGTSAGLAILGEFGFGAREGGLTSDEALPDPFRKEVALDRDFLALPRLERVITDTHFVERNRLGRTLVFLARIVNNGWATQPRGIGIDEETALLVLPTGAATMVGTGAAYFLQAPGPAQVLADRTPLTYLNIGVYKLPQGGTFNFSTWTGTGGVAYTLNVNNGSVTSTQAGGNIY